MGLLVITFAFYYLLVGKRLTTIHEDSKGEDSWNRYAGTFLLIFTAIITDYQLVFTTPDVMLIGTIIGIAVAGKVINTRIKEYPSTYEDTHTPTDTIHKINEDGSHKADEGSEDGSIEN